MRGSMLVVSSARATTSSASGSIATPSTVRGGVIAGCPAAASGHVSSNRRIKDRLWRIIVGSSRREPITTKEAAALSTGRVADPIRQPVRGAVRSTSRKTAKPTIVAAMTSAASRMGAAGLPKRSRTPPAASCTAAITT